jgi:tetratricopeptide (TPR) repeat protein
VLSSRLLGWTAITDADVTSRLRRQDRAVVSWALNELGAVHRMQGNPEVARNVLTAAQRLRTGWRSRGLAQVETNLGLTLLDLGEHDHAVHHLADGRILRARGDHHGRALSDLGLGLAYLVGHRYGEAHTHLQEAANAWTALDDRHMGAAAINTLGLVLWEQGDRYGALEHWHRARELYDQVGDALGLARAMLNIAAAFLAAHPHRAKEAVELLTESLRLRAGQPESVGTGLCHFHLADALARSGDAAGARDHRRHAARILAHSTTPVALQARSWLRAADAGDHARR